MPLKHFTETFLVVVLGAVIAVTGLLTSTLPNLPSGALPWALLFVLSVIYPLSLYSMFQKRRADNLFRNLHWFPAAILLVWLLLQGVVISSNVEQESVGLFTWGWTLAPVVIGFVFIVMFCLKVIRRRVPRLTFLALILIPYTAVALISSQGASFEGELADVLWEADFWAVDDAGLLAGWIESDDDTNLDPSDDEQEEDWRDMLRMQQRREERIASRLDIEVDPTRLPKPVVALSGTGDELRNSGTMPTNLPHSGLGWNLIILTLVGCYSAAVHNSARKRA
ncbi:MAG: hypothetical protein QF442_00940 [Candidatus Peribacteraceae bacterium]|jgi:hypothetical protein|nr:hypothetical protein [Candidatus Peribacteraceae bacterium]